MEHPSTDSRPVPILVGIGIIGRNGAFLVRQRPAGTVYEGYWEFPGGKCEPGESPEYATVRECFEEVGIGVRILQLRKVIAHTYPHGAVRLHFFDCEPTDPHAQPAEGTGFRWVGPAELATLRFPEANEVILEELIVESQL